MTDSNANITRSDNNTAPSVTINTGGSGFISSGTGVSVTVQGRDDDSSQYVSEIAYNTFSKVLSDTVKNEWRCDNR